MHQYQDLVNIFHSCFFEKYNTVLIKGEDEPLYLPADTNCPYNSLIFARGFFASALHECSHWLIAGEKRRTQVDFGYLYMPDGRSNVEQQLFQSMEIKPQALEWILSMAANYRFQVSIDNLNGAESDTYAFKLSLYNQVKAYCEKGLSERGESFRQALCHFYDTPKILNIKDFRMEMIL